MKSFLNPAHKGEARCFCLLNNNNKKITASARAAQSCSVLRAAVGCALWAERERSSREHGWCAGPSGQRSRKSHIWPRYQEGRSWYPLAAGQFHTEVTVWGDKGRSCVCPGREGFVLPGLPWLSLAAFAPGLILEAARSLGILEQICNWMKKRRAVVLCQAHFFFCVVGFLFLVLQFWFLGRFGCGLISSQSSVALTLWEFFFHGCAF